MDLAVVLPLKPLKYSDWLIDWLIMDSTLLLTNFLIFCLHDIIGFMDLLFVCYWLLNHKSHSCFSAGLANRNTTLSYIKFKSPTFVHSVTRMRGNAQRDGRPSDCSKLRSYLSSFVEPMFVKLNVCLLNLMFVKLNTHAREWSQFATPFSAFRSGYIRYIMSRNRRNFHVFGPQIFVWEDLPISERIL